jgi:LPS sulfotransferase NodH
MSVTNIRPFDGPEFDTPPDAGTKRTLTYVVSSTPRSGSGLLCRALAGTGVAGTPAEYFDKNRRTLLSRRWGCDPALATYTEALQARRTSPGGVFGIKLHWQHVDALRAESLGYRHGEAPFDQPSSFLDPLLGGTPTYVRILRSDVNRQAISLWTAQRSEVWNRGALLQGERSGRVPYSFEGIRRARARIMLGETHWERYFRFNGITPIEVVYEDLSANYEATVAALLEQLVPGRRAEIPASATRRLADSRSEELLARFLDDLGRSHPMALRDRLVPGIRRRIRSIARLRAHDR